MAKINIIRTNEWNNRGREIGIYIDGQKAGTIANGETKEFQVSTGQHQLYAKIDWCSSQEFSCLVENETKTLVLSGFKNSSFLSLPYYLTLGRKNYLLIKEKN